MQTLWVKGTGEREGCVHWETKSHLELIARGTTAPGKVMSAIQFCAMAFIDHAHPLLDILSC